MNSDRIPFIIPFCIFWMLCITSQQGWSQIPGFATDASSITQYGYHKATSYWMGAYDALGPTNMGFTQDFVDYELHAIERMHNDFVMLEQDLVDFIYVTSYGYIKVKFPLIPKVGYENKNAFGNVLTRALFLKKLQFEKQNIKNYLAADNPITEGQRVYNALCAINNIMITTLNR